MSGTDYPDSAGERIVGRLGRVNTSNDLPEFRHWADVSAPWRTKRGVHTACSVIGICLRLYRAVRASTSVSQPREGRAALRPISRAPRPHQRGGAVSRADPSSNNRELTPWVSRGFSFRLGARPLADFVDMYGHRRVAVAGGRGRRRSAGKDLVRESRRPKNPSAALSLRSSKSTRTRVPTSSRRRRSWCGSRSRLPGTLLGPAASCGWLGIVAGSVIEKPCEASRIRAELTSPASRPP